MAFMPSKKDGHWAMVSCQEMPKSPRNNWEIMGNPQNHGEKAWEMVI
jgi:hypothetical protein